MVQEIVRKTTQETPKGRLLEHPESGQGDGAEPEHDRPHLEESWPEAASVSNLQAEPGSEIPGEVGRCHRAVPEPARARPGAQSDEKSQIQALNRTQPGLPIVGRAGTMTHDYKRHGTTTLFTALNTLDGTVIGTCMPQHRHQEWIKFLRLIDRETRRTRRST